MPTLRYKKLVKDLPDLEIHTDGAAGIDLYCAADTLVKVLEPTLVPLGVSIEYPAGYMGILATRSSLPMKKGVFIPNGVGIIDSDYRGEHLLQLCALKEDVLIKKGERIAQIVLTPVLNSVSAPIVLQESDDLNETARGTGGFGSTGH